MRAAKAAAVILTAVSCSVYDASLLGSGAAEGGHGGTNSSAGHSGSGGEGDVVERGGSAGAAKGGSSGASAGDAGMMDTAGVMETGGESSEGGSSGTGGTAGMTGGAGTAGTAGTAGSTAGTAGDVSGGSSGTAGLGGGTGGSSAGAGGSAPVTGCAKLSVPLDASSDAAHFVISFSSAIDLSSATINMHLFVQAGTAGTVFNYVQDSQYHYFGITTAMRPPLKNQSGWVTLPFNVGTQAVGSTNIVKTDIRRIGIEINAAPDTTGWSNPTVVYVDSITVTTPALSFPFDTTSTVQTTPTGSDVAGQVLWQHSGSSDTTAAGTTLAWSAACP